MRLSLNLWSYEGYELYWKKDTMPGVFLWIFYEIFQNSFLKKQIQAMLFCLFWANSKLFQDKIEKKT